MVSGRGKRHGVAVDRPAAAPLTLSPAEIPLYDDNVYTISSVVSHAYPVHISDDSVSRVHIPITTRPARTHTRTPYKTFKALYDTGAAVSLLTPADFLAIKATGIVLARLPPPRCNIVDASQNPMRIEGAFRVRIFYKNKPIDAPFLVATDAAHSIIGLNIIKPMRLALDPLTCTVDFQDYAAVAAMAALKAAASATPADQDGLVPFADVRVLRDTSIKATTARLVTLGLFDHNGRRIMRDLSGLADLDVMAVAFQADKNGVFSVHIPNADAQDWKLLANTRVGAAFDLDDWQPLNAQDTCAHVSAASAARPLRPHTPAEKAAIQEAITKRVNATVPYQFRSDYIAALMQREHFFSASNDDLGFTDALQHSIDLNDKAPAFSPQFRLPADHLRLIQENVAGWLQAGIVERSDSKYNAPIFCVPKKHGLGLRCVLDYRRVNSKSVSDKYSIRTIDECLEAIGRAESKIFSCLDLTNGYWQLKLRASDRPFTAFTIPGKGQFQWVTTPQGLMGAPASFSRLMDLILSDAENVITYIDDVLVHSKTHKLHMHHLTAAIDKIGRANLRLNPAKCTFGASDVEYLGHTITSNGVKPGMDKSATVRDAPLPADQKALKSFLGLANYFRQYVPNFSLRAAPLFLLTRQDSPWKSGPLPPAAREAFLFLRGAISSRPVMAFPRATGRFHLFVDACLGDASNVGGLGAVLMQDQPTGEKRVIAFASRRLTKHEANYPAFLAEMQAAVYGMETFHHHLVGRRFSLYTDHKPLTKLSTVHTKTLNRLQLKMTELHPEIRYIEGKNNVVADFLSRYHGMNVSTGPPATADAFAHAVAIISHRQAGHPVQQIDATPFRLKTLQRLDPALKKIIDSIPDSDSTFDNPVMHSSPHCRLPATIIQDVLFVQPAKRKGVISTSDLRVAVPKTMRTEILKEAHNSWIGGHGGVFKTTERIKAEFWWPSMAENIEAHIRDCSTCLRATNKGLPPPPLLQPLPEPNGPNRRIHADLFGPLKSSVRKNNFVLVITDAFSKLARALALPGKEAPTVAAAMVDHMFLFGIPESIMTDQGTEFCNQLQRQIWDSLAIRHDVTTPYHPQCNAGAEVFNKTMKHYLATAIIDSEKTTLDWELYLGPLMFSYNTSINTSTRVSPFETTFGYDPRMPLWDGIAYPGDEEIDKTTFADYLARLRHAQLRARQIAHHNNQKVRQQYKDKHDLQKHATLPQFGPGDTVFVRDMKSSAANPKLRDTWKPAIIISREDFATYKVRRLDRKRKPTTTMNAMHIKPRPVSDRARTSSDAESATSRTEPPASRAEKPASRAEPPASRAEQPAPSPPPPTASHTDSDSHFLDPSDWPPLPDSVLRRLDSGTQQEPAPDLAPNDAPEFEQTGSDPEPVLNRAASSSSSSSSPSPVRNARRRLSSSSSAGRPAGRRARKKKKRGRSLSSCGRSLSSCGRSQRPFHGYDDELQPVMPSESSSSNDEFHGFDNDLRPVLNRKRNARRKRSASPDGRYVRRRYGSSSSSSSSSSSGSRRRNPARKRKRPARYASSDGHAEAKVPFLKGQKRPFPGAQKGMNKRLRALAIHVIRARRCPLSDKELQKMKPEDLLELLLYMQLLPGPSLPPAPLQSPALPPEQQTPAPAPAPAHTPPPEPEPDHVPPPPFVFEEAEFPFLPSLQPPAPRARTSRLKAKFDFGWATSRFFNRQK